MKRILILTALFIFACSSDDSNENNILTANSTANSDYNNLSYLKTTLTDPCE